MAQSKDKRNSQGLGAFSAGSKSQAIDPESVDTEIALVTKLHLKEILKNPDLLYEALTLSKILVITDGYFDFAVKTSEIEYLFFNNHETPYLTIYFKNGQSEDFGDEEEKKEAE